MPRPSLDDVLGSGDEFGLLDVDVRPVASGGGEAAQVLTELQHFVSVNGKPPSIEPGTPIAERLLATKAKRLSGDPAIGALLMPIEPQPPASIDDILDDDLLADDAIFNLTHVQPREVQDQPDYIGSRKPCADFERFRALFDAVATDLAAARRETRKFAREQEIDAGQFFIQKGMVAYVAEAGDVFQDRLGNRNRRLRVIYDNGTESDPLLRSFASLLYNDENGRRITDPVAGPLFAEEPGQSDVQTGHIYVARTLSKDPHLKRNVDEALKVEGLEYNARNETYHVVEVLHDKIGVKRISDSVENPLEGLRLATHPGCHLFRPKELGMPDEAEPHKLDALVEALGAETVDYPGKLDCCGSSMYTPDGGFTLKVARRKLRAVREGGLDGVVTICPHCFSMLDTAQDGLEGLKVPVIHYTQLLGLAMGIKTTRLGLQFNVSPVEQIYRL